MILITGASGFLGQHLVRHLSAKGEAVRALYHKHAPDAALLDLPNITWQQCDLLDIYDVEDAMQGVTDIYHCAAMVSFDPRQKERMVHINTECTATVINQALEQGIRRMVHVSSVAALGRTINNKPITEEVEWEESNQNSGYGVSKYMAEMEVWRGMGEGLMAVVVNPAIILGAGDWQKGSARLIKTVYDQFPFYTGGTTGWVDIHDVINALYMLMQSDVTGERYILSSGNYAFKDIFTRMADAMYRKAPHIKAGNLLTSTVARLSEWKSRIGGSEMFITRENARNAQSTSHYDNSKLLKAFPEFKYTDIQDTVTEMAAAYMKEQNKK